jgi:putative oxidoreductase
MLIGRIAIAGVFAWTAVRGIVNPQPMTSAIKSAGLGAPGLFYALVVFLLSAGSLMVIAGYRARVGALALLVIYLVAVFLLRIEIGGGQYGPLLRDLALAGGLMYIYAAGPGVIGMGKR